MRRAACRRTAGLADSSRASFRSRDSPTFRVMP